MPAPIAIYVLVFYLTSVSLLLGQGSPSTNALKKEVTIETTPSKLDKSNLEIGSTQSQATSSLPAQTLVTGATSLPTSSSEIPSLTAKEILSANNQVVNQVATMYQHLGLYLTILITLAGAFVGWMSYLSRKDVSVFMTEWNEKLKQVKQVATQEQSNLKNAVTQAQGFVKQADDAARKALKSSESINNSVPVLDQAIADVHNLKMQVEELRSRVLQAAPTQTTTIPMNAPQPAHPQQSEVPAGEAAEVQNLINAAIPSGPETQQT